MVCVIKCSFICFTCKTSLFESAVLGFIKIIAFEVSFVIWSSKEVEKYTDHGNIQDDIDHCYFHEVFRKSGDNNTKRACKDE